MENYLVSARKYRPSTFDSVVGQKSLTATLKNAIQSGRLAHAYLFCGSRGVGKTSCARIFAKTINCQHPTADGNPCNECDSCREFNEGRSLNIVELDAASNNGVDDIRAVCDQVQVPPTNGRYRVFIFDEVHMLTQSAFNSFLKTLEEPPSYVIFILATTEKHKILPTILSRCQIYDFNRITINDIIDHLEFVARQEGITAERQALGVIAAKADGAMRDALSIFDQVAASSRGEITYRSTIENLNVLDTNYFSRLFDAFVSGDVPSALLIYKEIRDKGFDSHFFVNGLADYLRNLMVAQADATMSLLDTDEDTKRVMQKQAQKCQADFFYKAMSFCNEADLNYRAAANKSFLVELLLIRLCQLQSPSPSYDGDGEGQLKPIAVAAEPETPRYQAAPNPVPRPQQPQPQPQAAPAGQRHVNPVQQPTVTSAPRPDATRHRSAAGLRRGPSLSDLARQDTQESASTVSSDNSERRSGTYTPEDVTRAWNDFMAGHPKDVILCNTMRACMPKPAGGDVYRITLENPGQQELLGEFMHELYGFMHDRLGNDNWRLETVLNRGEGSPLTWTDREVFNYLMKENPHFRELVEVFRLTL